MSDTREIISQSIANLRESSPESSDSTPIESSESNESSVESTPDPETSTDPAPASSGDETPSAPEPVSTLPVEPPAEEKKPEESDDFGSEPEFTTDARGRKQVNRIPHPRVKKMVESAVAKARSEAETEFGQKISTYEQRIQEYEGVGQVMASDPDRFLAMLQQAYPVYRKYFGEAQGQPAQQQQQPSYAQNDPMPQPDAVLADGTPAYSPEGFQRVQEWQARQVESRVLDKVNEQFGWVQQERQQRELIEAQRPVVRQQLNDAMTNWDGFQEHFDAILAELQNDRAGRLTLHDAYRTVITRAHKAKLDEALKQAEALKADRNKIREEVLRELQTRPAATAALPSGATPRTESGGDPNTVRDTRDVIREAIAKIRR